MPSIIDMPPTYLTTGLPHAPTALLLDFDGVILESEPQDLTAYLEIVARATSCAAVLRRP